jgi:type IX secretion system PorP/SprF family membrane protein
MGLTQIALSMASKVRVQANDFLKLGIQAAWMQYSYNFEALTWNSQFDGSSINPDLNSSENGDNESINFIDFSSGLLWTHTYKKENQFNLGFAAFHLARPRYYSAIYDEKLYVRWVLHGDYSLPVLTRELILEPSFLAMMQGPSHEVVVGLSAKYFYGLDYLLIENLSYLSVGMYYRNRDAIIIDTRFNYMSILDIDLSYDINISKLYTSTKARGGFEIALLYTIPDYKLRKIRHNHRVPLKKH